jgi:hypothetical protein
METKNIKPEAIEELILLLQNHNIGETPNRFMPQETIISIAEKVSGHLQNLWNPSKMRKVYRQQARNLTNRELLFYGYPMTTCATNGQFINLRHRDGIYQLYLNNAETRNIVLKDDYATTIKVEILNNEVELDVDFYTLEPYSPEAKAAYWKILDHIKVLDANGNNIFAKKGGANES